MTVPDVETVKVTIRIEAVTETRTFSAGFTLVGQEAGFTYELSTTRVLETLFGSVNDLDAAASQPLLATIDVTGLAEGVHTVTVTPDVPPDLRLVDTSPPSIERHGDGRGTLGVGIGRPVGVGLGRGIAHGLALTDRRTTRQDPRGPTRTTA